MLDLPRDAVGKNPPARAGHVGLILVQKIYVPQSN